VALYLPVENVLSLNSAIVGPMITISLPIAVLFFARAIDGLTGGNVSVADAYILDISSDENRSKNFGKMAISSNLGFIVGLALAGILGVTIYGEALPVLAPPASFLNHSSCDKSCFKGIQIPSGNRSFGETNRNCRKSLCIRMK
jgi:MFS family permease